MEKSGDKKSALKFQLSSWPAFSRQIIVSRRGWKKSPFWNLRFARIRAMPKRRIISAICFTTAAVTPRPSRFGKHSAKLDPTFSIVWRNLGIGYFNIFKQPGKGARRLRQGVQGQSRRRAAAVRARPALETAGRKTGEAAARTGKASAACFAARRLDAWSFARY